MGLLDGQLASAIYAGFKNRLLKGTLRRRTAVVTMGLDTLGDAIRTTETDYSCQGFVDEYSEFFRATAGIPDTDCKVAIFAKSLPSGVRPLKDDLVRFQSVWYQLRTVATDPATALWECRASRLQGDVDACRARGF